MLSVVIPAFNEEKNIGKCLEAFLHQTTKEKFELVVVDNASSDKTAEIIKRYSQKLPLVYVYEPQKGRGFARAAGFAKAKGEIILSTDADTIVPSNWIENMASYFTDARVIAVTGNTYIQDTSFTVRVLATFLMSQLMLTYRFLFGDYCLSGFNFAIRKDIYEKAGGFSTINAPEDVDLSLRVQRLGKITLSKNIKVCMSGRRFNSGIVKGFADYIGLAIHYFILKDNKLFLSDIR